LPVWDLIHLTASRVCPCETSSILQHPVFASVRPHPFYNISCLPVWDLIHWQHPVFARVRPHPLTTSRVCPCETSSILQHPMFARLRPHPFYNIPCLPVWDLIHWQYPVFAGVRPHPFYNIPCLPVWVIIILQHPVFARVRPNPSGTCPVAWPNILFWMKLLSSNLWVKLLHTFPTPLNYPIHVDKNANAIIWCPCKEQTMIQWLRGQRYYWKRDPTWPTTWPPCEDLASKTRASREKHARIHASTHASRSTQPKHPSPVTLQKMPTSRPSSWNNPDTPILPDEPVGRIADLWWMHRIKARANQNWTSESPRSLCPTSIPYISLRRKLSLSQDIPHCSPYHANGT
jgi:hypothetical protein